MIHTSLFTLPKQLVRVWRNEFTRVICDRLSSEQVSIIKRTNNGNRNVNLENQKKKKQQRKIRMRENRYKNTELNDE